MFIVEAENKLSLVVTGWLGIYGSCTYVTGYLPEACPEWRQVIDWVLCALFGWLWQL